MKFLNNCKLIQNRSVSNIEKKLFMDKIMNLIILLIIGFSFANSNVLSQNDYGTTFVQLSGGIISSKSNGANLPQGFIGSDIKDKDGNVWVRAGAPVVLISDIKKARRIGKPGHINIRCLSTIDINGNTVALTGSMSIEGKNKSALAIGLGMLGFVPGMMISGFFFLFIKGEDVIAPPIIPAMVQQ